MCLCYIWTAHLCTSVHLSHYSACISHFSPFLCSKITVQAYHITLLRAYHYIVPTHKITVHVSVSYHSACLCIIIIRVTACDCTCITPQWCPLYHITVPAYQITVSSCHITVPLHHNIVYRICISHHRVCVSHHRGVVSHYSRYLNDCKIQFF